MNLCGPQILKYLPSAFAIWPFTEIVYQPLFNRDSNMPSLQTFSREMMTLCALKMFGNLYSESLLFLLLVL